MLYHGSTTSGLKVLKPFPHNGVSGESVVFATTDIRFALAMIHGTGNQIAVGYIVNTSTHKESMYLDELVPHAFAMLAQPGVLYELEDSGFQPDSRLSHSELISRTEARIIKETAVPNVLEELRKYDITLTSYEKVLDAMKERGKNPHSPETPYSPDRFA